MDSTERDRLGESSARAGRGPWNWLRSIDGAKREGIGTAVVMRIA